MAKCALVAVMARARLQGKAAVAIGAIDKAVRTNGQEHARMAKAAFATITGKAAAVDFYGFRGGAGEGRVAHALDYARFNPRCKPLCPVLGATLELRFLRAGTLIAWRNCLLLRLFQSITRAAHGANDVRFA